MRIDEIAVYHVAMPLKSPWRTAYGDDHVIESVLVCLTSGDVTGWGEACPLAAPTYSPEHAAGVFATVTRHMAPLIVGRDFASGDELQAALSRFKGNPFAKASLDTAWWALQSRLTGRSLAAMIGTTRQEVAVGADFGVQDSIELLLDKIDGAFRAGFARVKLKIRPGWDTEVLRAVRQRFPPPAVFHVDCNAGYNLALDREFLLSLDQYQLAMIEQPLGQDDGLLEHAELQKLISTPVCLDECLSSLDRATRAVALGSGRVFNIKPGRCGGFTVALQIAQLARQHNIPCWVGGMLESAVGAGFCISLAMLDSCTYPGDIFASENFYANDMSRPHIETPLNAAGVRVVRDTDGVFPFAPDADLLAKCTLQSFSIKK